MTQISFEVFEGSTGQQIAEQIRREQIQEIAEKIHAKDIRESILEPKQQFFSCYTHLRRARVAFGYADEDH